MSSQKTAINRAEGEFNLVHLIHRASQITEECLLLSSPRAAPTARQLLILQVLSRNDKVSQKVLVQRTGIDRSTLADVIKRLVRNGWVSRRRSRVDARQQIVHLTEAGRAVLAPGIKLLAAVEAEVLSRLPTQHQQILVDSLLEICRYQRSPD